MVEQKVLFIFKGSVCHTMVVFFNEIVMYIRNYIQTQHKFYSTVQKKLKQKFELCAFLIPLKRTVAFYDIFYY